MAFFTSAIDTLKVLVIALGAGLGVWGVINLLEGYGNDNPGANGHGFEADMHNTPDEKYHSRIISREKNCEDINAILGGIAPKYGTQRLHGLFPLAVIGRYTDIPNVWLELLDDLIHIF